MSVLKKYFDKSVNQESPVQVDLQRKVDYDADGNEFISWIPVDYPAIQQELGSVEMWSLNALTKAGIDPRFGIKTGFNTRLDGLDELDRMVSVIDSVFEEENNKEQK